MSFDCVNIPTIPEPQGADVIYNKIQVSLGLINWLEYSFGKAFIKKEIREGSVYVIPKVWAGSNEYEAMIPNDTVKAFSFIEGFETETITDYENRTFNHDSEINFSIVVFANLNRIDNTKSYIFTEELKKDVLEALTRVPSIEITSIENGMDAAYSSWSYESIEPSFYSEKYTALKFNLTGYISGECYTGTSYDLNKCN